MYIFIYILWCLYTCVPCENNTLYTSCQMKDRHQWPPGWRRMRQGRFHTRLTSSLKRNGGFLNGGTSKLMVDFIENHIKIIPYPHFRKHPTIFRHIWTNWKNRWQLVFDRTLTLNTWKTSHPNHPQPFFGTPMRGTRPRFLQANREELAMLRKADRGDAEDALNICSKDSKDRWAASKTFKNPNKKHWSIANQAPLEFIALDFPPCLRLFGRI